MHLILVVPTSSLQEIHLEQLSVGVLCSVCKAIINLRENVAGSHPSQGLPLLLNEEVCLNSNFNFLVNSSSHLCPFFKISPINFKMENFLPD